MEYEFRSFEVDASAFKPAVTAQELRLGNWLYSYTIFSLYDKEPAKEGCISPFRVDLKTLQMIYEQPLLVTMKPIPLTDEILQKAGVPDKSEYQSYHIGNHFLAVWDGVDAVWFIKNGGDHIHFATTGFVHQLQNLYFSLTEKELEINL